MSGRGGQHAAQGGKGRGSASGGRGANGKKGKSQVDWKCLRCEKTGNFGWRPTCFQCGAARGEKSKLSVVDGGEVSAHAKVLRRRTIERGDAVRLLTLVDEVCVAFGVRYLGEMGLSIDACEELRELKRLEALVELQLVAYVEARFIATLFELEAELVKSHGLRSSFDELRLGPLLAQPKVKQKFYPDATLTAVPRLSVRDVACALDKYRKSDFKRRVDLTEFLNWFAASKGASSPRALCVAMSKYAVGTLIKLFCTAAAADKATKEKLLSQLQEERRKEWQVKLDATKDAERPALRDGSALSPRARDAALDFGALGATESLATVVEAIQATCTTKKKNKTGTFTMQCDRFTAVCELAAMYTLTLGEVDSEATRSLIAAARGLSDEELVSELGRIVEEEQEEEGTTRLGALARRESALLDRLRLGSFEAMQRGSFLAFLARALASHPKLETKLLGEGGGGGLGEEECGDKDDEEEEDQDRDTLANVSALLIAACDEFSLAAPCKKRRCLQVLATLSELQGRVEQEKQGSFAGRLADLAEADPSLGDALDAALGVQGAAQQNSAEAVVEALAAQGIVIVEEEQEYEVDEEALARRLGCALLAEAGCSGDVQAWLRRSAARADPAHRGVVYDATWLSGVPRPDATSTMDEELSLLGRALAAAPTLVELDERLCWTASGACRRHGSLLSFCAARQCPAIVVEDKVYKLELEPSFSALQASAAAADPRAAVSQHLSLVVRGLAAPDAALLRECWRDGLLRLGSARASAAFAARAIEATPAPLRAALAPALFFALEAAADKGPGGPETALLAAARPEPALLRALHDLAARAEQLDSGETYPVLLADFHKTLLGAGTHGVSSASAAPSSSDQIRKQQRDPAARREDADEDSSDAAPADGALVEDQPKTPVEKKQLAETTSCAKEMADLSLEEEESEEPAAGVLASIRRGFGLTEASAVLDVSENFQLEALDNALKVIARDIYSQDAHFLLELIQNADDNDYHRSITEPTIAFDTSPSWIVVRNNETGFRPKHVRALCHVGASSKGAGGLGYIGQKGIGFKSVFRVSSRPEIHSRDFAFALDEHMVVPTVLTKKKSSSLAGWLEATGARKLPDHGTTIVIPLTPEFAEPRARAVLAKRFTEIDALLLLFLNKLQRIEHTERAAGDALPVRRSMSRRIRKHGKGSCTLPAQEVTLVDSTEVLFDNDDEESAAEVTETRWLVVKRRVDVPTWASRGPTKVSETVLGAAFVADEALIEKAEFPVFAFLPIAPAGLRFVLHADWILASSRETVRGDSAWNEFLRSEVAPLFVDALVAVKQGAGGGRFDVATVLSALPLEREVVGFFRPAAAEIVRRVRGVECCKVIAQEEVYMLPSATLALSARVREVQEAGTATNMRPLLSPERLLRHVNRQLLDASFQSSLRPEARAALGVESFGEAHALRLLRGLVDSGELAALDRNEALSLLREWCVLAYRAADGVLSKQAGLELRKMRALPVAQGGTWVAAAEAPVYFDSGSKVNAKFVALDGFDACLSEQLRVIDPDLLGGASRLEAPVVVSVLRAAGLADLTPAKAVFEHLVPSLAGSNVEAEEEAAKDGGEKAFRELVVARWRYVGAFYFGSSCSDAEKKRLVRELKDADAAMPVITRSNTKQQQQLEGVPGLARLGGSSLIRVAREHGNQWDVLFALSTTARRLGWRYLDLDAIGGGKRLQWRELARELGVCEVARQRSRTVLRGEPNFVWEAEAASFKGVEVEAHDLYEEDLEALLAELAVSEEPTNEDVLKALVTLARAVLEHPELKGALGSVATIAPQGAGLIRGTSSSIGRAHAGLVPSQASKGTIRVASSLARLLGETRWLPGEREGHCRLYRPRELFSPLDQTVRIHSGGFAPLVAHSLLEALSKNPRRALEELGCRLTFTARDGLDLLDNWAGQEAGLTSSIAHFEAFYRLLWDELQREGQAARDILALFARPEARPVWVPDYRHSAIDDSDENSKLQPVPGRFYAARDCVWADHSHVIDSCLFRTDGFKGSAPRVLARHYPTLRGFWCRSLCASCFGSGLGSRGREGCMQCSDRGGSISAGIGQGLVASAASVVDYSSIAERVATLASDFEQRRVETLRLLGVLSFTILTGRLEAPLQELLPHLLRSKRVWPTKSGAFAALEDEKLIVDDAPQLSALLLEDPDIDEALDVLNLVRGAGSETAPINLSQLGVNYGEEHQWLSQRLGEMVASGALPASTLANSQNLLALFEELSRGVMPLLGLLKVRRLSELVRARVYPSNTSFARHPSLHDFAASSLRHAQRWLRSKQSDAYSRHEPAWSSAVSRVRVAVCDELEVVHSLATPSGAELTKRVPRPAHFVDGTLYVARVALDGNDWEPVASCLASLFQEGLTPAEVLALGDTLLLLKDANADKSFERRGCAAIPEGERLWQPTIIDDALCVETASGPQVSRPQQEPDLDEEEQPTGEEPEPAAPAKVKKAKRKPSEFDGAAWPPTDPSKRDHPSRPPPPDTAVVEEVVEEQEEEEEEEAKEEEEPNETPSTLDHRRRTTPKVAATTELLPSTEALLVEAASLVGELQGAMAAGDRAREAAALEELLALPSGPHDAHLARCIAPALRGRHMSSHREAPADDDVEMEMGPVAEAHSRALARWASSSFDNDKGGGPPYSTARSSHEGRSSAGRPESSPGGVQQAPASFQQQQPKLESYCVLDRTLALVGGSGGLAAWSASAPLPRSGETTEAQAQLGLAGEALAAEWLRGLASSGDLGRALNADAEWSVRWVNSADAESGLPFDIELLSPASSRKCYIEVKTTSLEDDDQGRNNAPFEFSLNQMDFARAHPEDFFIARVFANHDQNRGEYSARRIVLLGRVDDALHSKAIQLLLRFDDQPAVVERKKKERKKKTQERPSPLTILGL